jgi:glycosyltransferase involved in cell wall biosynthesis
MIVTIFTPTYNRDYIINTLYESLLSQTNTHFEWLIVDDGSTDGTDELIQSFINQNKLVIRYYKQPNGGKHIAINKGVTLAKGELFFIVDSDDYLTDDAVEKILNKYKEIADETRVAGVSFRRGYDKNKVIGHPTHFKDKFLSFFDFRYRFKVTGDQAEVYKTDILKEFPFPSIEEERFCPESLVWNRIGKNYKLMWTSEIIYICNYLNDGLTSKITKIRMQSPIASMMTYSELESYSIPLKEKIKANINFWRFSFNTNKLSFWQKLKRVNCFFSILGVPLGYLMFIKDKKKS